MSSSSARSSATLDGQEEQLQREEDDLTGVAGELAEVYGRLRAAAADLSKGRQRVAKKLVNEAQKQLAELGMADARLDAELEAVPLGDDPVTADVPAWGA